MYGHKPRLSIDVEVKQQGSEDSTGTAPDPEVPNLPIEEMVEQMKTIRHAADGKAMANIKKAEACQKKNYHKCQGSEPVIGVGEKVCNTCLVKTF